MTAVAQELRSSIDHSLDHLPVAIIGAGPVGLAAAAQLAERGIGFVVLEAGPSAGTAVAQWGHTRLFSPWEYLIDAAAGRLLDQAGWDSPRATRMPYGRDLVADYLLPLAACAELAPHIRFNTRVTDVSRQGMDRTRSANRAATPFLLRVTTEGTTSEVLARAVIDTSGTYNTPNGLTASGLAPVAPTSSVTPSARRCPMFWVLTGTNSRANTFLLLVPGIRRQTHFWPSRRSPVTPQAPSSPGPFAVRARCGSMGLPRMSWRDEVNSALTPTTWFDAETSRSLTTSRSTISPPQRTTGSPLLVGVMVYRPASTQIGW